jgi:alpha-beta hydrolase superfamily lysophospholipase
MLFGQGEGDLVSQDIDDARPFSKAGWNVYMYDYRGYGRSGGIPGASALVNDFRELAAHIKEAKPKHFVAYGGSLGGVILANALDGMDYDALVLDSVPSRISVFCPSKLNPIEHIPADSKKLLVISGTKDRKVPQREMKDLLEKARRSGATVWDTFPWYHIFDSDEIDVERFNAVVPFLARVQ